MKSKLKESKERKAKVKIALKRSTRGKPKERKNKCEWKP
jgi:hypothetical protein